jgi:hypothetical protein
VGKRKALSIHGYLVRLIPIGLIYIKSKYPAHRAAVPRWEPETAWEWEPERRVFR